MAFEWCGAWKQKNSRFSMGNLSSAIELIMSVMQSKFSFFNYVISIVWWEWHSLEKGSHLLRFFRDLIAENLDHLSQNSIALFNLFECSRSNFITSSTFFSVLHHAFIVSRTLETVVVLHIKCLWESREIKGDVVDEIFMDFVCSSEQDTIGYLGKSFISEPDFESFSCRKCFLWELDMMIN